MPALTDAEDALFQEIIVAYNDEVLHTDAVALNRKYEQIAAIYTARMGLTVEPHDFASLLEFPVGERYKVASGMQLTLELMGNDIVGLTEAETALFEEVISGYAVFETSDSEISSSLSIGSGISFPGLDEMKARLDTIEARLAKLENPSPRCFIQNNATLKE